MSHHRIDFEDVSYCYPDGTAALEAISLTIGHGESVALVGGNGAGKSTLLQHLVGVLWPSRGRVRVGGAPVVRETLALIRRAVGLVFQDPDDQLFMPTVGEDVAYGPSRMGLPPEEVAARVRDALERVGILHLRDRAPFRMSFGEKRLAALAAVLAMSPDILALDEPSANLDPLARRRLIGLLGSFEHTRIVATHDLDLALDVCARTIVLSKGRIVADGTSKRILADGVLLASAGLERPLRLLDPAQSRMAAKPRAS
jgi:cobalt/nickel transport system ATP-binding protein